MNHPKAKEHKDCVKRINEIVKKESFHKETDEYRCDYKSICFGEAEALDFDCVVKNLEYEKTPAIQDFILIFCKNPKNTHYLNKIKKGNKPKHNYEMMFLNDFKCSYF